MRARECRAPAGKEGAKPGSESLGLDDLADAPGRLDALTRAGAECMGVNGQGLAQLALGQDLHGHVLARAEPLVLHQLNRHLGASVESSLEVADVDGLGTRTEWL